GGADGSAGVCRAARVDERISRRSDADPLSRAEARHRGGRGQPSVHRLAPSGRRATNHRRRVTLADVGRTRRVQRGPDRGAPMNRGNLYKTVFTNPLGIRALLWSKLPLAAFAGLRVGRLDETGAEVRLPAGWKTQNPFGSTYFAAQAMAAEFSTGAPALWFIEQSGESVSSLVTAISAKFTKKAT